MTYPFDRKYGISSDYKDHFNSPIPGRRNFPGVDYLTPAGTKVRAMRDGRLGDYIDQHGGKYAVLIFGNERWDFLHLDKVTVERGKWRDVHEGEVIGITGNTGMSTGPHTHLGWRVNGKYRDPTKELDKYYDAHMKQIFNLEGKLAKLQVKYDSVVEDLETANDLVEFYQNTAGDLNDELEKKEKALEKAKKALEKCQEAKPPGKDPTGLGRLLRAIFNILPRKDAKREANI